MLMKILWTLLFLTFTSEFAVAHGEHPRSMKAQTDQETFKALKEKSVDPKTGLPQTLDPNLFRGKAKQAYQVAKEIPEVLAQMPCFCECETYGHETLLDCFIDHHGAG